MRVKFIPKITFLYLFLWFLSQNFNVIASEHSPLHGSYKIKKVVLDAGHGGKDTGCIGHSSKEKHNTLAITLKVGNLIQTNYPDVEVIYTRDTDVFIPLHERAKIANRNNADLFISIHCNAISVGYVHGTETYIMGMHTADSNLEVVKRENAAILLEQDYQHNYEGYDPNSPEAHIIGSMYQANNIEQSLYLASFIQKSAVEIASRKDKGVKQAGFLVLRATAMPSVLVETGYLTNRDEDAFLASDEGQWQMAQAIFDGFQSYKMKMEGNAPAPQTAAPPTETHTTTPSSTQSLLEKPEEKKLNPPKKEKIEPVVSNATKPIATSRPTISPEKPAKSMYRILLITSAKPKDTKSGLFKLVTGINEVKRNNNYFYYIGKFAASNEAEKMLVDLKNIGFTKATLEKIETDVK